MTDKEQILKDYKEQYDKQSEEYQKLKQDLFLAQNQITLKNEYIQKVKQECEELKEKLEKFYTLAGEPIEYFLDHYTNLCEDFLLDDRDEDDNTIPILEQIRDRLEDKDTLEEENTRYRKGLEEIEEIVKQTCRKRCTNDCLGTRKHCGYGAIFNIINKAKGEGNEE